MPRVRFLITLNPNEVLGPEHKMRLPGIVGWNLVKLVYQEFPKNITLMYLRILNALMESFLFSFSAVHLLLC